MKIHKMVCLDIEVVEALKGMNASSLINDLLKEHLKTLKSKTIEELQEELRIKKIELKAIKEIENGK